MSSRRIFYIIFSFWVLERILSPLSFYFPIFFGGAVLMAAVLMNDLSEEKFLAIMAGGLFFDFSSGIAFGTLTIGLISVYSLIILCTKSLKLMDSWPIVLFSAIIYSSIFLFTIAITGMIPIKSLFRPEILILNSAMTLVFCLFFHILLQNVANSSSWINVKNAGTIIRKI